VILVTGSAVVAASVFLPWVTIYGYTYTFFGVDGWKALPIAQLIVVAGGVVVAALGSLHRVKLIGAIAGGSILLLDFVGAFAAAKLADVHSANRVAAAITIGPAWGGWLGLLACGVVLVGALSSWPAVLTVPDAPESPPLSDDESSVSPPPYSAFPINAPAIDSEEGEPPLPHLDKVLAPPKRSDREDDR
jgi:hypothetical protein